MAQPANVTILNLCLNVLAYTRKFIYDLINGIDVKSKGKPGDQAEEEELQLQVAAPLEPFEDTQERYALY